MKITRILLYCLFVFAAVPAFSEVTLTFYSGETFYSSGDESAWEPVSNGMKLITGDIIKTGSNSYAELNYDGHYIKVYDNSRIKITESMTGEKKGGSFSVFLGAVLVKIKKLGKDEGDFTVDTPSAICAIRGTEFEVGSGYDGATLLQVASGTVALKGETSEVEVKGNQESGVELGGNPVRIRELRKQKWEAWAIKTRKKIKGNELRILKVCEKKMLKLEKDIAVLEDEVSASSRLRQGLRDKVLEYKKNNDDASATREARLAHRAGRRANILRVMIGYKAHKIELVRGIALTAYDSLGDKREEAKKSFFKIEDIYGKMYERYIRLIKNGDERREKIIKLKKDDK